MSARQFCTITASTKRRPAPTNGIHGASVTHLASLLVTPLYPLSQSTQNTLMLNSPREFRECYHVPAAGDDLPDVVEGDVLVIDGTDYPIESVGPWEDGDIACLQIVAQVVKRTWPSVSP